MEGPSNSLHNANATLLANNEISWTTIYAAGFNAHSQLQQSHTTDLSQFEKISEHGRILFTSWATTVLIEQKNNELNLQSLGYMKIRPGQGLPTSSSLRGGFGNHERMLGCVSDGGRVAIAQSEESGFVLSVSKIDHEPLLSHVAIAGNGKIAVTYKQAPKGRLCHVSEFEDEAKFLKWLEDPSGDGNYPAQHHMLPGRPKQLLACSVSFLLLMESGEVYSWGDPRHRTLGRSIGGAAKAAGQPAAIPAAVEALGGLQVQKVACGGWMSAALSADGAVYVWGGRPPGVEQSIVLLQNRDAGDVALVEILEDGDEPLDLVDVAVGDAHIAVVTQDERLFVVGSNSNGQLGIGEQTAFAPGWQHECF